MANGKIRFGKQSGGQLALVIPDGVANTEVVVPESGTLVSVGTTVTDNAIARFDGTTGQVQNSGVVIDDNGNVGVGVTPSAWSILYKNIELGTVSSFGDYAGYGYYVTQLRNNAYENNGWKYKQNGYASMYDQYAGMHSWSKAPSGTADNPITWHTAMTLKLSGNLLVGTTVDNGVDKLQVIGSIKATELNVSDDHITKVSKNVPGLSGNDYTDRYFILFKTPKWGLSTSNYSVKGSLIVERHNNLGVAVYTDFSVGSGYDNEIYKTYFQNKGNVGTSLVYVTINSIQYVAIHWYVEQAHHAAWFDGFITNMNASGVIDNLCGTIFETAKDALSRIII